MYILASVTSTCDQLSDQGQCPNITTVVAAAKTTDNSRVYQLLPFIVNVPKSTTAYVLS